MTAVYVAVDRDPYRLVENAAKAIVKHLNTGRLHERRRRGLWIRLAGAPGTHSTKRSGEKVRTGLQSFKDGAVCPDLHESR